MRLRVVVSTVALAHRGGPHMRRYWIAFASVTVLSFAVLGFVGVRVYQSAPPIPQRLLATDGTDVVPSGAISAVPA
jgi:nitric oxide reductase subunit B